MNKQKKKMKIQYVLSFRIERRRDDKKREKKYLTLGCVLFSSVVFSTCIRLLVIAFIICVLSAFLLISTLLLMVTLLKPVIISDVVVVPSTSGGFSYRDVSPLSVCEKILGRVKSVIEKTDCQTIICMNDEFH